MSQNDPARTGGGGGGGAGNTADDAVRRLTHGLGVNAAKAVLVSDALGVLKAQLQRMDGLQQQALSVGMTANTLRNNLGSTLQDLPGGMVVGMESTISFMQIGMKNVTKGMLRLAGQAKVTGQNTQQVIAGLASMATILPMTGAESGKLGANIMDFSRVWGTTTTMLSQALSDNATSISQMAALNEKAAPEFRDAVLSLTAQAPLYKGAIKDITKAMTFEDGAASIQQALLRTGKVDLVNRMRSGKNIEATMREFSKAVVENFQRKVGDRPHDTAMKQMAAKALGFSVEQIAQFKAFNDFIENQPNIMQLTGEQIGANFDQSLTAAFQLFVAPFQISVLPLLEIITTALNLVAKGINMFPKIFQGISVGIQAAVAFLGLLLASAAVRNTLLFISNVAGNNLVGTIIGILGGLLTLGMAAADATEEDRKAQEAKRRSELEVKDEEAAKQIAERKSGAGTLAAALEAARMAQESILFANMDAEAEGRINQDTIAGETNGIQTRILAVLERMETTQVIRKEALKPN